MRLLHTTSLTFEEFYETKLPRYAILSHCWGEKEVAYNDMRKNRAQPGQGLTKIRNACKLAKERTHDWIWIDTCCIDKKSSAELSEAINSMFRWYERAEECYAYLADVTANDLESFKISVWFTRGWTLQELLAPRNVLFYDSAWKSLGNKDSLVRQVSSITGIPEACLMSYWSSNLVSAPVLIQDALVGERMSWASKRRTSRPEDLAYCLLGIFDVNMPLLYGEGAEKAFIRLQIEILNKSCDETIFAWVSDQVYTGILATEPRYFEKCTGLEIADTAEQIRPPWGMTNRGLSLQLIPKTWWQHDDEKDHRMENINILLQCRYIGDNRPLVLTLRKNKLGVTWSRTDCSKVKLEPFMMEEISASNNEAKTIFVYCVEEQQNLSSMITDALRSLLDSKRQ